MLRYITIAAILFASSVAWSAEPNIKAYAAKSRAARPMALATAKQQLELAKRKRQPKHSVQELERRIAALENPLEPYYAPTDFKLEDAEAGMIGWIDESVSVKQIIDDAEALVIVSAGHYSSGRPRTRQFQLTGLPTAKMDSDVLLNGVFLIDNGEYATLGGQPVLVIKPVDTEPHKDLFTRKDELRDWTSAGGHTTEAIFVRHERGKVTLMNLVGKTVDVKLADLSDEDRQYVRDKLKELQLPKANRRR